MAARLNGRVASPRAVVWLILIATAGGLVSLSIPIFTILGGIAPIRIALAQDFQVALVVQANEIALERALAAERLARLATDAGTLLTARAQADAALSNVAASIARVAERPAAIGRKGLRDRRLRDRRLRGLLVAYRDAAQASLDAIASYVPDRLPGSSPGAASLDTADQESLELTRKLAAGIIRAALNDRELGQEQISAREKAGFAFGGTITVLVVLLLGLSATRLFSSRRRLRASRAAESLQAQLLAGAVAHMRDGVAVFDASDRLILRNPRFDHTAGTSKGVWPIGVSFNEIARGLASAEPPLLSELRPEPGQPVSGEMRVGTKMLEVYRSAMPGGGQMLAIADVTRRVQAEAIARQAQKMDVLGRLTSGVAHDFNNLLQALSANLEVLSSIASDPARDDADRAGLRLRAASAMQAVDRGIRLTRHLLAFARRQDPDARPVDTPAMLDQLVDLIGRTVGDRIELRVSIADGLWPVFVNADELENAILNLAINARDAMPEGGAITIAAWNLAETTFTGDEAPGTVAISVTDTGSGMAADELARAIEPFYTTKPEGLGTGLGLSIVHGFAGKSGGALTLTSEPGRGTAATLTLPRARVASVPAATDPGARPPAGRGETILLVEDDLAVLEAVRGGLEQLGYRVVEAPEAATACRLIEDLGVRPDLLLTDVMMPGHVDVAGLASRARAVMPDLPILFNTGDLDAKALRAVVFDARMALLAKPWRLEELARHIDTLLAPVPRDVPEPALEPASLNKSPALEPAPLNVPPALEPAPVATAVSADAAGQRQAPSFRVEVGGDRSRDMRAASL